MRLGGRNTRSFWPGNWLLRTALCTSVRAALPWPGTALVKCRTVKPGTISEDRAVLAIFKSLDRWQTFLKN
jgi:hypothetical protein